MEERSQTLFKPFSDSRRLQLLAFAFTNQLSRSCPTENWRQRSRIDQAREIAASRLLDEINHKQVSSEDVEDLLEGAPTSGQLLHEASDLVQGTWTDQELVPFCISMAPPIPPFDISSKEKRPLEHSGRY
jgi:hypothetical protein